MRAKIIWSVIDSEKEELAEKMGLPEPEPDKEEGEIYFRLSKVESAYLVEEGITIHFDSGSIRVIEYEEDMWDKIKIYLEQN